MRGIKRVAYSCSPVRVDTSLPSIYAPLLLALIWWISGNLIPSMSSRSCEMGRSNSLMVHQTLFSQLTESRITQINILKLLLVLAIRGRVASETAFLMSKETVKGFAEIVLRASSSGPRINIGSCAGPSMRSLEISKECVIFEYDRISLPWTGGLLSICEVRPVR